MWGKATALERLWVLVWRLEEEGIGLVRKLLQVFAQEWMFRWES
jgi:hypothetical protein